MRGCPGARVAHKVEEARVVHDEDNSMGQIEKGGNVKHANL